MHLFEETSATKATSATEATKVKSHFEATKATCKFINIRQHIQG